MDRPTRDEYGLLLAHAAATRGTCERAMVGVAIVKDGRPLVTGYNGAPAGMPHCDHSTDGPVGWDIGGFPTDWSVNKQFQNHTGCENAVHAEANAIAFAARHGVALDSSTMYLTDSPCPICAKLIINAGIVRVAYHRKYRLTSGLDLLRTAKIMTDHLIIDPGFWFR